MVISIRPDSTSALLASITLFEADGPLYVRSRSEGHDWYWTDTWQRGEARVDDYIERGMFEEFDTMEDFLGSLGLNE